MSFNKLNIYNVLQKINKINGKLPTKAFYSRRSDSKTSNVNYKVVKSPNILHDGISPELNIDANWELLAPRGYRFMLPGSLGAACQGVTSTWPPNQSIQNFVNLKEKTEDKFDLQTCECPVLLRKSLAELFPHSEVETCAVLTVVTLSNAKSKSITEGEKDVERTAMLFVYAAQEICSKLTLAGYWADFINPFSGRPYNNPFHKSKLYDADERFRCLGFSINDATNCTVIQSDIQPQKNFKGNLFTDAPANIEFITDLVK